ncbi:MAG: LysM peptidoglycan-binding domain-containing protein [Chloroflexi bacterium]|nr:LysM peptidoglycan-binding domain-containing protein [Chloroflexota bacterium]
MTLRRILASIMLVTILSGLASSLSLAEPPARELTQGGPNLLQNPGFEGLTCAPGSQPGWCNDNWTHETHVGRIHENIFTPQGWVTWWREDDKHGQPEVKTIPAVAPFIGEINRIRSGNYALLLFTFYRLQDMGVYQVVKGLEPGSTVQFSAHAHGWSCDSDSPMGRSCGDPWNQRFRVGIEPNGVADPFSPNIIWSPEQLAPDNYTFIGPVTAQVGESGTIVVYLRSQTKWAYKYADAYWDDASLTVIEAGTPPTPTEPPPPPTATPGGPTSTPRPTPSPRPDGAVVHIVQEGDTLFGLALEYGVSLDQIRQLNAGSIDGDLIGVGQELVISMPSQPAAATPLPEPPTPEATQQPSSDAQPTQSSEAPPAAAAGGSSVCVLAYHDRNADTFQNPETEELLPNALFTISDASGTVAEYTSDGISEPYCFSGLQPGAYRVVQTSPPGYVPSGPQEWPVALSEGTSMDLQFGNVRDETAPATEPGSTSPINNPEDTTDEPGETTLPQRILSTAAKVAGVLVLLLALGAAGLFILTRQRR